jgi:hypothetical protein
LYLIGRRAEPLFGEEALEQVAGQAEVVGACRVDGCFALYCQPSNASIAIRKSDYVLRVTL